MIEFLWFVILVASLVGLWFARTKRKSAPGPEIPQNATLFDRVCAWIEKFSRMELRWWLVVGILIGVAIVYLLEHGIMRVGLNLFLFFDWHPALVTVLLALSLAGLVFAWRGELTIGRVVSAALIVAPLALLVFFERYCLFVVLLTLSLLAVLWVWQDRLKWWAWIGSFLIVFLAAALFLSDILYGVPDAPPDTVDYLQFALVLALSLFGLLRAWRVRARLLGRTCAFLVVVLIAGLLLSMMNYNVPQLLDEVGDWMLIGLGVVLVVVAAKVVLSAQLQPLGWASAVMVVFLGGGIFLSSILYGTPEDFAEIEDQFKYGSIGSDHFMARGIPYYVWQVLPKMFPPEDILMSILPEEGVRKEEYMPRYGKKAEEGKGLSYEAFGMLREKDRRIRVVGQNMDTLIDRPIGFSKRKVFGMDFIGLNCAFCHASTIQTDAQSGTHIVSGMPANTVDIELFFLFLFGATGQPTFTSDNLMKVILDQNEHLKLGIQFEDRGIMGLCQEINNSFHRLAYRIALIPLTRIYAQDLKVQFSFIDPNEPEHIPRFGPGRVDAWSPGKRTLIKPSLPVLYPGGIIDHTSIWNQKARNGMRFHWDGNTDNINERNIIAGLVVNGPQIECLDVKRVLRITDWIKERPAPRFEDFAPQTAEEAYGLVEKREAGRRIFQHWCASCHAPDGDRIGRVEPINSAQLGTDPERLKVFTAELADDLNTIGTDQWQLRNFKVQNGYVNMLLDGIWMRAPYLHNGSVPTLRDLLNKPCEAEQKPTCRPQKFYRGQDLFDWKKVGFKSEAMIDPGDTVEIVARRKGKEEPVFKGEIGPKGMVSASGAELKVWGLTAAEVGSLVDKQLGGLTETAVAALLKEEPALTREQAEERVLGDPSVKVRIHKRNPVRFFEFDTRKPGNRNRGHLYGTDLRPEEKEALVEFLKTL